ncbi:tRNA (adenine(22)-N(1))-methyltransferase [Dolosicoccus paucivorans]|uniref:tRNA (Adenine(22)-N(1))-methyltransferase TrmK n=1 Tax=Dolosicoccus paucivorans TaxID=84521 RepID=A0A1G8KZ66_9LACT|nr:tRNA (adenine(22)-N(1))-methyltransferase TrmK [Dolosicoccus paucivorans]PMB85133.1 hypothetical protein CJ206_00195 [Dolosicoccus paucivorans]PMC58935.1 hypothetical protein CJ205_01840 [Dolosicoccus paucivorans]SDI48170.1 tRNA (adenine22-N1)-methyltransferase [Dolosicoccus paucivorans]
MIQLSPRLQQVAQYVQQYAPQNEVVLCDVGSDHAYLPSYLLLNNHIAKAIAGEVVEGPFRAAQKMKEAYSFKDRLSVRLGDGLSVIKENDQVNVITICGMGGVLIRDILNEGQQAIKPNTLLILQPNMASNHVRKWISDHESSIIDEIIVEDHGRLYEVIVAIYQKSGPKLTYNEELFGPINLKKQDKYFVTYWSNELNKLKNVQQQMTHSQQVDEDKVIYIKERIKSIEEVLLNDD